MSRVRSLVAAAASAAVVATALALAQGFGVPSVAADPESACEGRNGVLVVVDFAELGGGVRKGCSSDGGIASGLFERAGFPLVRVIEDPSFVCRVSGKPAEDSCADTPGANAYWSLWTADGTTESWSYAQSGVDGLRVKEGGYLAFAWHQGGGRAGPPGVNPTKRTAPSPSPSPTPTAGSGSGSGTKNSGGRGSSATPTAKATESASAGSSASASPTPSESGSPSASDATTSAAAAASSETTSRDLAEIDEITAAPPAADDAAADGDGGFPAWVGIGLAVLVLGAAGAVPIIRRRGH